MALPVKVLKKLRDAKNADKVADNEILEFVSKNLRSRGSQTTAAHRTSREVEALMRGDDTAAINIVQNISGNTAALFPLRNRLWMDKTAEQTQKKN